jgi:hypothetical protein
MATMLRLGIFSSPMSDSERKVQGWEFGVTQEEDGEWLKW